MTDMEDPLARIPNDILVDSVLPACSPQSLAALGATSRRWHDFIATAGSPCEILWQRRAVRDFKFPVHSTGRRTGWYRLYTQLASSSALANQNGRLGIPPERWPASSRISDALRRRLIRGGLPVPTRIRLPEPPTTLAAGGWSFHALTLTGKVVSWGELQPSGPGLAPSRELNKGQTTLEPRVLPQMDEIGPVQQLTAGREHVVLLGEDGKVWEYRAAGRVANVQDEDGRWGSSEQPRLSASDVISIHAGWAYSTILTATSDLYMWWKPDPNVVDVAARAAGEDAAAFDATTQGVTFALRVNSIKLPPLPENATPPDRIRKVACGDEFIVVLSDAGKVFYLDISLTPATRNRHGETAAISELEHDFLTGRRQWTCLEAFCSAAAIREHATDPTLVPSAVKITHISAHFNTFAAYSVPSTATNEGSVVLLGKKGETRPQIIPELQNLGVIQLAHGDYHNLALTSNGRVYSWGAYSSGALGLGHPDLPNTPLAIPPPLPHEEPAAATPTAATPAPGLVQRAQAFLPPMPATPAYLSSLLPGGLLGGPGPAVVPRRHVNPPERVDKPTEIIFDGEGQLSTVDGGRGGAPGPASTPTTRTKRNKFVYSITAGGWHSGCLAVDLNPDEGSRAAAGAKVETPVIDCYPAQAVRSSPSGEAAPLTPATDAAGAGLGGINVRAGPFRIGFAGRGANRGAGGSGLTRGGGGATYRRPLDDSAS
ncbi:hypothetical protein C6P46_002521 [Rhodotorula mucilaginosa]|uniref:Regulator of chromosome condensation 1/beta-lactamase-inhibitor protein II n=1 Tax=Rhodotorula mucilaginosa TaxID=5537 RepID=A0A9P6W8A5_RHOMI|nr:hypothetical protein C6P46_002521 [Rhodotorula mucilaginosa]